MCNRCQRWAYETLAAALLGQEPPANDLDGHRTIEQKAIGPILADLILHGIPTPEPEHEQFGMEKTAIFVADRIQPLTTLALRDLSVFLHYVMEATAMLKSACAIGIRGIVNHDREALMLMSGQIGAHGRAPVPANEPLPETGRSTPPYCHQG